MRYTFDPAKQAANVVKHGVFFAAAQEFEWETVLVAVDDRHGYGETRFTAVDLIGERVQVAAFSSALGNALHQRIPAFPPGGKE